MDHSNSKAADRLPPHQQWTARGKWPPVGERTPRVDDRPWTLSIGGLVGAPKQWSLTELRSLPQTELRCDLHCVTRWSMMDARFAGVSLATLLELCSPGVDARFLSFVARSDRDHSSSLPLADALALGTLLALDYDAKPMPEAHGGPIRLIVPGKYLFKSVKWVERIEVLAEDRLGYWEAQAGYHNGADPWKEERYIASDLSRFDIAKLLERRDFSGLDLLGLQAAQRALEGLAANSATLRNADFRGANLRGARFERANLSNAHLDGADLQGGSFRHADVEGASFVGADLRGVDFTGAFLTAATFASAADDATHAVVDNSTKVSRDALDFLVPLQREFLASRATVVA